MDFQNLFSAISILINYHITCYHSKCLILIASSSMILFQNSWTKDLFLGADPGFLEMGFICIKVWGSIC